VGQVEEVARFCLKAHSMLDTVSTVTPVASVRLRYAISWILMDHGAPTLPPYGTDCVQVGTHLILTASKSGS
jgi:hypothetical protein